jgi:hypothetical protein
MSQVIVVNDLSNLGEQLKAALAGSGIDASQFGDIGAQIQKALADAGLGNMAGVVPAKVAEPVYKPIFGELIDSDEDSDIHTFQYNVKGASSIELTFDDNGDLGVSLCSENDEDSFDTIDCSDLLSINASAVVNDDVLTISIPVLRSPDQGQTLGVTGFTPFVPAEDDADEEDGEWCDECNEYHPN